MSLFEMFLSHIVWSAFVGGVICWCACCQYFVWHCWCNAQLFGLVNCRLVLLYQNKSNFYLYGCAIIQIRQLRHSFASFERKCDLTGKHRNSKCMSISHSKVHTHKVQHVNLHERTLWWPSRNKYVKLRLAASTLRTLERRSLDSLAKDFDIDLNQFAVSSRGTFKKTQYNSTTHSMFASWMANPWVLWLVVHCMYLARIIWTQVH